MDDHGVVVYELLPYGKTRFQDQYLEQFHPELVSLLENFMASKHPGTTFTVANKDENRVFKSLSRKVLEEFYEILNSDKNQLGQNKAKKVDNVYQNIGFLIREDETPTWIRVFFTLANFLKNFL